MHSTTNSVCYSKDVRLPQQLQRAMAAEAEAAREARAKVGLHSRRTLDLTAKFDHFRDSQRFFVVTYYC